MAIDYKFLGERIKAQRREKGATQEHFAEYLNVSVGYISQIERGITKVSLERLIDISEYLECDVSFLLEGTSIKDDKYLACEYSELFHQLSVSEKRTVILLLKEYIRCRSSSPS